MGPDGKPVGLTCNSFASVSLNPPLVLWSPGDLFAEHERFPERQPFYGHVRAPPSRHSRQSSQRPRTTSSPASIGRRGSARRRCSAGCVANFQCRAADRYYGGDTSFPWCRRGLCLPPGRAPAVRAGWLWPVRRQAANLIDRSRFMRKKTASKPVRTKQSGCRPKSAAGIRVQGDRVFSRRRLWRRHRDLARRLGVTQAAAVSLFPSKDEPDQGVGLSRRSIWRPLYTGWKNCWPTGHGRFVSGCGNSTTAIPMCSSPAKWLRIYLYSGPEGGWTSQRVVRRVVRDKILTRSSRNAGTKPACRCRTKPSASELEMAVGVSQRQSSITASANTYTNRRCWKTSSR